MAPAAANLPGMKAAREFRYRGIVGLALFVMSSGYTTGSAAEFDAAPAGTIVFERGIEGSKDIHTMNADGSGVVQLTEGPNDEFGPSWSPDGSKIAFWSMAPSDPLGQTRLTEQLMIMKPIGPERQVIWTGADRMHDHARWAPAWSPDGTTLAFASNDEQTEGTSIYTIRIDGSNLTRVTANTERSIDVAPAWSPNGKTIYFSRQNWNDPDPTFQIFSVRPNGTGLRGLTFDSTYHWGPKPSPDGKKILFVRGDKEQTWTRIFVMKPDGSSMRAVTKGSVYDFWASWSPDGRRIIFTRDPDGNTGGRCAIGTAAEPGCSVNAGLLPADIYTVNLTGGDLQQLSDGVEHETQPSAR